MAISATYQSALSLASTSNLASYVTTTGVFTSGTLYVVAVLFTDAEAPAEVPTSVVLSGTTPPTVTRVTAATAAYATVAAPLARMTFWWFVGDGVSRTITVTQPDAGTGCMIYTVSVTGANNASPIAQGAGNQGDAGSNYSCTLAAFSDPVNNGAIMFVGVDAQNALTIEAGWTEFNAGTDITYATPATRISGGFRTGEDTSPSMNQGSGVAMNWGIIAVEVNVPAVARGSLGIPMV